MRNGKTYLYFFFNLKGRENKNLNFKILMEKISNMYFFELIKKNVMAETKINQCQRSVWTHSFEDI